jgi:hypothetical protein
LSFQDIDLSTDAITNEKCRAIRETFHPQWLQRKMINLGCRACKGPVDECRDRWLGEGH